MTPNESFPLSWPVAWPRTPAQPPRCVREPSGRLVCCSRLADGSALRTCWWDDGVQPVIDEGPVRISAARYGDWIREHAWRFGGAE